MIELQHPPRGVAHIPMSLSALPMSKSKCEFNMVLYNSVQG